MPWGVILPLLLAVLLNGGFFYMLNRNFRVAKCKRRMLNAASEAAIRTITQGDLRWRVYYDRYESVGYNEMLFKVWRRVDSFYDVEALTAPLDHQVSP